MADIFKEFEDEFLKFDNVNNKMSQRADLHAFMLLDKLVPGRSDIVSGAEHDEIFLGISPEDLIKVATKDQLLDLHRCGVMHNNQFDSLTMFA